MLFYDTYRVGPDDPVQIAWGKNNPGQVTNITGGVAVPVPGYSFDDETWMRVRVVLDQTADTLDLYIDGELLLDDAGIASDAISCERLCFATRDGNEKVLIDNIFTEVWDEAPRSCGDGSHAWLTGDISGPSGGPDCYVNNYDLDAALLNWLNCNDPADAACQ